ncbi:hypothetical protein VPH35_134731 [Triticum aestivum]
MWETQGWADLPEDLLHSIVARLGLGSATFPPLLLRPDVPFCPPHPSRFRNNIVPKHPYLVTDIAKVKQDNNHCSEIPSFLECLCFIGASFGHVILYNKESCTVVHVFRHVIVLPPQLPVLKCGELNYGALTASLTSLNSHLIVETGPHNLFWRVGGHSWVRCSAPYGTINQIMVFKGRVFGMDSDSRIFKIHLTPEISMQELPVMESAMISKWHLSNAWLVACGDTLLLVEKLENWEIFISTDKRTQPLSCLNPEIWGGRSNCIYCYYHEAENWVSVEVGKPLQGDGSKLNPNVFIFMGCDSRVQPMRVVPSTLSWRRHTSLLHLAADPLGFINLAFLQKCENEVAEMRA